MITRKFTANVFSARMNNTYNLSQKIKFTTILDSLEAKTKFFQGEMLEMWRMDLGLRYTFMDGKAALSARVNDVFKR